MGGGEIRRAIAEPGGVEQLDEPRPRVEALPERGRDGWLPLHQHLQRHGPRVVVGARRRTPGASG